jgi:hypothetical protein
MERSVFLLLVLTSGLTAWSQAPVSGAPAKAKNVSPLTDYAGLWTATFEGKVWLQLELVLNGEQLSGSLVHARNINFNDSGELKSVSEEQASQSIASAVLNPDGLLLTAKNPDTQETDHYLMRLVMPAKEAADLRMIGEAMPPGMPKPKPWRMEKSGAGPTKVPAPQ